MFGYTFRVGSHTLSYEFLEKKCQVPKGDDVLPHPICMYILYSTVCWCQSTIIEEMNEKHNVKVTRIRLQQGTHTIITFEKFVKEMGKEKKTGK